VGEVDVTVSFEDARGDTDPGVDRDTTSADGPAEIDTAADDADPVDSGAAPVQCETVRIATFNASLFREAEGELLQDLQRDDAQAQAVAHIIRTVRPDILLLNEFDEDLSGETLRVFQDNYLQNAALSGSTPIAFEFSWIAASNTGVSSGVDLSGDGRVTENVGTPNWAADAFGFGTFPGQYSFAVLSKFEIEDSGVRTFQTFRWKDFEGALLPDNSATAAPNDYYAAAALDVFRLSSKNHADIPIRVGQQTLHFLVSHPTPPAFDGPEDRNGRRNHDEVVFWARYIDGADWIYDDAGNFGALASESAFVIAGDLNSDPLDPADNLHPVAQLLSNSRVNGATAPASVGARLASQEQGGINVSHRGDPSLDTADFSDENVGNLRIDHVIPSSNLTVVGSGVFWPGPGEPGFEWVGDFPFVSSDHRAVWIDVLVQGNPEDCTPVNPEEP
jgi:hypothetical protein